MSQFKLLVTKIDNSGWGNQINKIIKEFLVTTASLKQLTRLSPFHVRMQLFDSLVKTKTFGFVMFSEGVVME